MEDGMDGLIRKLFKSLSDVLRIKCDEDGTYIVSDYRTIVYGDGESPFEALCDYIISLIEYNELLLKSGKGRSNEKSNSTNGET